jgi:hypothetical protein
VVVVRRTVTRCGGQIGGNKKAAQSEGRPLEDLEAWQKESAIPIDP